MFISSYLVTLMRTSIIPSYRLTDEQNNVLRVIKKGDNVFITGQGGTGKSFLVGEVFGSLETEEKKGIDKLFKWYSDNRLRWS